MDLTNFKIRHHLPYNHGMKLWAISDLHLSYPQNRTLLAELPDYGEDWLIVAGDIGEREAHFHEAFQQLSQRFARLIWVPGNHDLYTIGQHDGGLRGVALYQRLVEICRQYKVVTPEDPYVQWPDGARPYRLVPLFTLYDYSFRPDHIPYNQALDWAAETNVMATDEAVLHADPYPSRAAWCADRCRYSEERLQTVVGEPLILINHYPLREDLLRLWRIPRFSLWCGTRRTEDWHSRYGADIVVYGHTHMRATDYRDGTRFEEVSLGYPRNYNAAKGLAGYLRQILPAPG
ncbi:MAG: metallophosphoesterase [Anaerolineales bacterium]|nr:metallophosphoesterase [Anaerolineales bacterium]MCB0018582.1 metallophosphoesterase [Anaerolineales bacterium]